MFIRLVFGLLLVCGAAMVTDASECKDTTIGKCGILWCHWTREFAIKYCPKSCNYCHLLPTPTTTTTTTTTPAPLNWNQFTPCSRSCGGGTRYRVPQCTLNNIDTCPRVYQDCKEQPCPLATCPTGENHYYGLRGSCCKPSPSDPCGGNPRPVAGRVFGGQDAMLNQWPFMVRLEIEIAPGQRSLCGANIISKEWAVTAGHCIDGIAANKITAFVAYGTADQLQLSISQVIIHPDYLYPGIDIALIKFSTVLTYNEYVSNICLPNGEETEDDKKCYIVGWGSVQPTPVLLATTLQQAKVRKLPYRFCEQAYSGRTFSGDLTDERVSCAGRVGGGVDACVGDSGGPLACQRCSSCSWYLAAVTSFGPVQCGPAGTPGLYTNVAGKNEAWIRGIVTGLQSGTFGCQ